ncbi:hypothetical protein ASG33_23910 [Dyadobacter sp. Leaf189]|nr:hypothetical protein ASG33_23910 [Dyadobacter sp. Leaf189]
MKSESYLLTHDESCCYFEFLSEGKQKEDRKVVLYSLMDNCNKYNLCLGHVLPNGELCDLTVSNNGDMEKIISTVIKTISVFLNKDPSRSIYLQAALL